MYGVVVNGLCKRGEIDLVLFLFKKMDKVKIEVNFVIYNIVIDGFCRYKYVDDVFDLFSEMEKKGVRLNVFIFSGGG